MTNPDAGGDPRSFYIGPQKSRLLTGSWQSIQAALAAGLLDESQWVERKQDVPPAAKKANLELAKDLASLAIGGGVFVIGVADKDQTPAAMVGANLDGLQDRISQVSQATIRPALAVTFDGPYPNPDDPTRSVLIVVVPPSPGAPHMVDGRYWGRSPDGKRQLPDDEVRLLLDARRGRAAEFRSRLEQLASDLDPTPARDVDNNHLYLLAEPAVQPTPLTLDESLTIGVIAHGVDYQALQPPVLLTPQMRVRSHSDGHLFTSGEPHSGPVDENSLVRLLLKDDGTIQVVAGAGDSAPPLGSTAPIRVLHVGWFLDFVDHLVHLVSYLSETHLAYTGPWQLGLRIDRMAGVRAAEATKPPFLNLDPYVSNEYLVTTTASYDELRDQPQQIVERLAGRLLRGLGIAGRYLPYKPMY